ncbi:MAG: PTS fructose transporter subunit IIA [Deltaproteobacteria bacterium]|nr:PTS fructose transporter subunit IIA [Deltaproteobacteria bacterium]
MLGYVIVTHVGIGREMLKAVEEILKEKLPMAVVEVDSTRPPAEAHDRIEAAVAGFNDKEGVLILTDIFGATPTNLCRDMLTRGKVAVVTGINLPMVLKAATARFEKGASEAAEFLKNYGCDNIRTFP